MREEFEAFLLADPVYFDHESRSDNRRSDFPAAWEAVPAGWQRHERDVWVELRPEGYRMPRQGWKVHVSACPDNGPRIVKKIYDYCIERGLAFKFLRGRNTLRASLLKYAERSASGKLVTIYPRNTEELRTVLTDLGEELAGEPGPYILTDLRWGEGPLYVRYGAFVTMYCADDSGEQVPALVGPDGELVPDARVPTFSVPDWVEVPDFLAPYVAARAAHTDDFPYQIDSALHFSNGGGVYLGRRLDESGTPDEMQVVLKEARPYAGLDSLNRDAVTRLRVERDALRRLAGVPGVPQVVDYRQVWEHEFLVQDFAHGDTLSRWIASNYPLIDAQPDPADLARYAARARAIADQITTVVDAAHARGLVIGDLHPTNVLVDPDNDDRVTLIDLELASDAGSQTPVRIGVPGFKAWNRTGPAADRHALAAIKLWLLMPMVELVGLVPEKVELLLQEAARLFPVPERYLHSIRDDFIPDAVTTLDTGLRDAAVALDLGLGTDETDWSAVRRSLAAAIQQSATPDRTDRLFPGDYQQFVGEGAGIGFGYGAAGVLWALDVAAGVRSEAYEQWLLDAAAAVPRVRPGFFDGLSGLAYTLDHLGHHDRATELADAAAELAGRHQDVSLHSGLAGCGLTFLHFESRTGESGYLDAALAAAERLGDAVVSDQPHGIDQILGRSGKPIPNLRSRGGLVRGWSGPALFFCHLYERTGDVAHLDMAVRALHRDLDLCEPANDGSLQVDVGYAVMPYLNVGSAGIALTVNQILDHRADERLVEALPLLARACWSEFTFEAQLFTGRAGLMATLAMLGRDRPELETAPAVARHLRRLAWHAVAHHESLVFPGSKLLRLSMDLATGSAGVLLAAGVANGGGHEFLPFVGRRAAVAAVDRAGDATGWKEVNT